MLVGVEPAPLVATVLEVEARIDDGDSALPLRVGITMGPVILFEGDDYIGTTVNLASRLCDAAGPRQILAQPPVAPYIPAWGEVSEPGRVMVPGFPEPVEMVLISRRGAGQDPFTDPVCGMTLPRDSAGTVVDGTAFCSDSCAASWTDPRGREAIR
jgi:class 3 adenylate cyclase